MIDLDKNPPSAGFFLPKMGIQTFGPVWVHPKWDSKFSVPKLQLYNPNGDSVK